MRILLIEDEREIASLIVRSLKANRFAVDWAKTSEEGLLWAKVNPYDLGIVDINLGRGMNGLEICKEIRGKKISFPIIILSVVADQRTKVDALNMGADDYLTKPFVTGELLARINALLRREKKMTGTKLKVGELQMDLLAHIVRRGDKEVVLNKKEFALLEYFMRNPGITLTRTMILEHVWDMNADPFTNTVDVHVRFLRAKIDDGWDKKVIITVHGHGYRLEKS